MTTSSADWRDEIAADVRALVTEFGADPFLAMIRKCQEEHAEQRKPIARQKQRVLHYFPSGTYERQREGFSRWIPSGTYKTPKPPRIFPLALEQDIARDESPECRPTTTAEKFTALAILHDKYRDRRKPIVPQPPCGLDGEASEFEVWYWWLVQVSGVIRGRASEVPDCDESCLRAFVREVRGYLKAAGGEGKITSPETDKPADKRTRRADKHKRPLNDEARACINAFKQRQKAEPSVRMKPFCLEYAEKKGGSFASLYRTITDYPEMWKEEAPADKPADNRV